MPPSETVKSLVGVVRLAPQLEEDLLVNVDRPFEVARDPQNGKSYILCDYNRDGDCYRSPWTNKYYTEEGEVADGVELDSELRKLEIEANQIFDIYRKLYFDTGISSVYFFATGDSVQKGFGAAFAIHKDAPSDGADLKKGAWDSLHVFSVVPQDDGTSFSYTLSSSLIISMIVANDDIGTADLSGTVQSEVVQIKPVDKFTSHIMNMGAMVEEAETKMRNNLELIYIQKAREVLAGARSSNGARDAVLGKIAQSLAAVSLKKAAAASE